MGLPCIALRCRRGWDKPELNGVWAATQLVGIRPCSWAPDFDLVLNLNDDNYHQDAYWQNMLRGRLLIVIPRWIVSMPVTSRESIGLRPVLGLHPCAEARSVSAGRFSPLLPVVAAGPVS